MNSDNSRSGLAAGATSLPWLIGKSSLKTNSISGWRRMAIGLTSLTALLTTFLTTVLLVSLYALNNDRESIWMQTLIFSGNCEKVSRTNLYIHLAINAVSSGVLASSNFFMQALIAQTRREVDKAHAASRWVEIRVESIDNIRVVFRRNVIFWGLCALSSVPLHLRLNGCVLESKASTGFQLVMALEFFAKAIPYKSPSLSTTYVYSGDTGPVTVNKVWKSVSSTETKDDWERMSFQDCIKWYDNSSAVFRKYRHVIMVLSDQNGTSG